MKIVAFGASNSKTSINQQFAAYAASFFDSINLNMINLNHFQAPLYSVDEESENGIPENIHDFVEQIKEADLLIISLAEHNGSYSAAFKNIFDWATRVDITFINKKMLLLSTAPGPRGGKSVLEAAQTRFPIHGAEIIGTFSLPVFGDNFSQIKGILAPQLKANFQNVITSAKTKIVVPA